MLPGDLQALLLGTAQVCDDCVCVVGEDMFSLGECECSGSPALDEHGAGSCSEGDEVRPGAHPPLCYYERGSRPPRTQLQLGDGQGGPPAAEHGLLV